MSYAITRVSDEHLGFLLLSGGPQTGDCIFRSLPKNSIDFETPDSLCLFDLQCRGEFHWKKQSDILTIIDVDDKKIAVIKTGILTIGDLTLCVKKMRRE